MWASERRCSSGCLNIQRQFSSYPSTIMKTSQLQFSCSNKADGSRCTTTQVNWPLDSKIDHSPLSEPRPSCALVYPFIESRNSHFIMRVNPFSRDDRDTQSFAGYRPGGVFLSDTPTLSKCIFIFFRKETKAWNLRPAARSHFREADGRSVQIGTRAREHPRGTVLLGYIRLSISHTLVVYLICWYSNFCGQNRKSLHFDL